MPKKVPDLDLGRLCASAQKARLAMEIFRRERVEAVRQAAGHRYSRDSAKKKVYLPLISMYQNIVGRQLISSNPKVMYSTFDLGNRPAIAAMQDWANDQIVEQNMVETFKRLAIDALYSVAIVKVALASAEESSMVGWKTPAGQPFVKRIDLDDWVFDINAREFWEAGYMGHRFRAPMTVVQNNNRYDAKARKKLSVSNNTPYNAQGDEKIGVIGKSNYRWMDSEFEDMVDLWEIYVPRHKCVYTFADDELVGADVSNFGPEAIPLLEQRWMGPEEGPYDTLGLDLVPGNPFPIGPILHVIELHEAANNVYRKLVNQAHDQKTVMLFQGGMEEDAERVRTTNDRGLCAVTDPRNFTQVNMNGPDQANFLFLKELILRFSWCSGNLETIGGLAAQAGTLGQEELLNKQSNGQIAGMQDQMTAFVSRVFQKLNWFWWNHPSLVMKAKYQVPGNPGIAKIREVHPFGTPGKKMSRDGEMPRIKVDPYSMRATTPQQRAGQLQAFVTGVFAPMAQIAQQQGVALDFNEFLKIMAQYNDMPEMQRVLTMQQPLESSVSPSSGAPPGKPPETTRNYNRISSGANSKQAEEGAMENSLAAGANAQSNGALNGQAH